MWCFVSRFCSCVVCCFVLCLCLLLFCVFVCFSFFVGCFLMLGFFLEVVGVFCGWFVMVRVVFSFFLFFSF